VHHVKLLYLIPLYELGLVLNCEHLAVKVAKVAKAASAGGLEIGAEIPHLIHWLLIRDKLN
jgi:hypothetical protein